MRKEIYISVKDLVAECIRKAWIIIILMLLFAVLLGAYKYKKDVNESNSTVKEEVNNVDDAISKLSESDYNKVMSYIKLVDFVKQQESYVSNSLLMKMDPYHANIANLQYYVSATDENKQKDAVVAYLSYISNGGLAEDMYENDDSVSFEDLKSAITCDAIGPVSSNVMMEGYTNVINIMVYGESEKQCKSFVENIKNNLVQYNTKINAVTENTITLIDESYSVQTSTVLLSYQTDRMNNLATWNTRVLEEEKELDQANLALAKQIMELDENVAENKDEEVENNKKVSISKKFVILGAFAGFALSILGIIIVYIIDGRLKTEKELQMMYGIRTFGSIIVSGKPNVFENIADKVCYRANSNKPDETGEYCVSQIITLCKNTDTKNLVLVGEEKVYNDINNLQILQKLNAGGVKAEYIGDVVNDAVAIRELKKEKKVVLLESARKSFYVNIEQQINEIQNQGVEILGYITVK